MRWLLLVVLCAVFIACDISINGPNGVIYFCPVDGDTIYLDGPDPSGGVRCADLDSLVRDR